MKNFLRPCNWVVLGCLLIAIFSALAFLPMAQSSQDQNEATATLNLTANYTADYKSQNRDEVCEDHLTLTYGGVARYKLLPAGYGTGNEHPESLSTYPRAGVQTDRTGRFTISVQGGGSCIRAQGGGKTTWTYGARYNAVPPNEFPSIGVQLRPGDYRVGYEFPESVITSEGQIFPRGRDFGSPGGAPLDTKQRPNAVAPAPAGIPYQARGHALFPLLAVMQQSIQKVSAALHGTFTPNSKEFSRSNSVSDTFQMPPNNDGQTGTASLNISYTLTVGNPEEVEAVIIPDKGYEQWMPQAGDDENSPGDNPLTVKVVLQKKGQEGKKPTVTAHFKFELVDTSHEPGVCLNWPPKSSVKDPPDFDLKIVKPESPENIVASTNFLLQSVAKDGQSAESLPKQTESAVTITSFDWGGWGKLKITAILDDVAQTQIVAHLKDKPDIEALSIPKDDNGNHIADEWEKNMKDKAADSDNDKVEWQDLAPGDGLSLYEEYRGFMVDAWNERREHHAHMRTNPEVPDVFVYDQDNLTTGIFYLSGMAIHIVDLREIYYDHGSLSGSSVRNPLVINFNYHNAHLGDEHAIWLQNADPGRGMAGIDVGGPGPPRTSLAVRVGKDQMVAAGAPPDYVSSTIGHELAHAVNVWHHGDSDYSVRKMWILQPDKTWSEEPQPKGCKLEKPTDTCYDVAAQGGQESGVQECIMRYEESGFYEWDGGPYRWLKNGKIQQGDKYGPGQPSGTLYCQGLVGTGVNAPSHAPVPLAGNASRGGCAAQFCANDTKPCIGAPH